MLLTAGGIGLVAGAGLSGCAERRAIRSDEEMVAARAAYLRERVERGDAGTLRLLNRLKRKQEAYLSGMSLAPPVFDVLILSGGGDYGAFGSGFLEGWATLTDPGHRMPEFDLITGVSTGALIGPFAMLGDPDSLARASKLYSSPRRDWVSLRGLLFFLPSNESLLRIDGLKRDIRAEFGPPMIERLADAWERGRVLAIGTTNLDLGTTRVWNLGFEAAEAQRTGSPDRLVDVLLASSAIPGVFPPVEIDGFLYTDGAVSGNIVHDASRSSSQGLAAAWAREFPGSPPPRSRFWVIVNNQLIGPPEVVQPSWTRVTGVSISKMIRASTLASIEHLAMQVELLRAVGLADVELRYVAVPEAFRAPVPGIFEPETMSMLVELGRKMGADPSSWQAVPERLGADRARPSLTDFESSATDEVGSERDDSPNGRPAVDGEGQSR
jgi:predicted acylesterase/phospholipase RssA